MQVDVNKVSPMMRQYIEIKNKYKEHILFFRLGDFYEMFFDDALFASKELGLTLTGRDCGLDERAPMCGIPYHSYQTYVKKLIENGYSVAICEQTSELCVDKGIVARDVLKIITPGTLTDDTMLDETKNNYLCCIYCTSEKSSVCFSDISTGEVHLYGFNSEGIESDLLNEIYRYNPVEILYNNEFLTYHSLMTTIKNKLNLNFRLRADSEFSLICRENVFKQFNVNSFSDLGIDENNIGAICICALFSFISETQKSLTGRFVEVTIHQNNEFMQLDLTARRNLELTETLRNKERKGSLLWVLDYAKTSMGKRMLKNFIEQPLVKPAMIIDRLEAVEDLTKNSVLQDELIEKLSNIYDIERLMTRVMYKSATPRDLLSLSVTAKQLPGIKNIL